MTKKLLVTFLLLNLAGYIKAQQLTVSGTVSSATDGLSIPFVTVAIKGTTTGVNTNIDGKYILTHVSAKDTLLFSSIGYETKKVAVDGQAVINVVLHANTHTIDNVVVTALGVSRQKRELGYSTETVDGKKIAESNAPNILSALSGEVAGVQVVTGDGVDGTTRITIRGNNSISGDNQPLIVVDGVPMDNDPGLQPGTQTGSIVGRGVDWGSAINNVVAADIENITVLKGGAASALYGARGAGGVLLITTKKGTKQKGLGVTYNTSYRITEPYRYREVQNEYGGGAPLSLAANPTFSVNGNGVPQYPGTQNNPTLLLNGGGTSSSYAQFGNYGSAASWGPKFNNEMIQWWDGSMRPWSAQPNNVSIPYRDGQNLTNNISVEGGSSAGSMRVSFSRTDDQPIIYNSGYTQTSLSTNSTLNVSSRVTVNVAGTFTDYNRLNSPALGDESNSIFKAALYSWPRNYQGEDKAEYQNADGSQNTLAGYPFVYVDHYLWWEYYNDNTTLDRQKLLGGVTVNYHIVKWLNFTGRTGIDYTINQYTTENKPTDVLGILNGYYANSLQRDRSNNSDFLFAASSDSLFHSGFFKKFKLGVSGGGETWDRYTYQIGGQSGTWYYPNSYTFANYTASTYNANGTAITVGDPLSTVVPTETYLEKKINSLYAFIDMSYNNFIFVQLTGRNDWSSTLPINNDSYFYPSISASFIPFEAFNYKSNWFTFLKIRANISQTATDAPPYQTYLTYNTSFFNGQQSSALPAVIPAENLRPQRVNAYEGGTQMEFFKGLITADFTYYDKYAFDQIMPVTLPASAGATSAIINNGALSDKGYEAIVAVTPVHTAKMTFKTGINFGRNRNKVVSLGSYGDTYELGDIWGIYGPAEALHVGDDFGTIYGYDYVYKNGQRVLNSTGTQYEITSTEVPVGNASPHLIGGWTTQFRYKNFSISTLVDVKWGGDIYSGSYAVMLQTGQAPETLKERDGGGLPYTDPYGNTTNTGVILPGVHADGTPNNTVVSYYYKYMPNDGGWGTVLTPPGILQDTYIKLREVAISYRVPTRVLSRPKIFQNLTLSIVGRDLLYLYTTLPDKINPEGAINSGNVQAFEFASLAGTRSVSFSINAKF